MLPDSCRAYGSATSWRCRCRALLLGLAASWISFFSAENGALLAANAKMTLVPDFDLSTVIVSAQDGLHHLLSNSVGKTWTYRADRRVSKSGKTARTKHRRDHPGGLCAILFFVPGKRLATPTAVVGQENDPLVWDWAWPWKYYKLGFEHQDQVEKVVVAAPQLSASSESLREDAVEIGEQMMSVLDQAVTDYSCNSYKVYIHAASHGGLVVRTLMTMDDRIWTPTHRAGGVSQLLVDFHRTLNDSKIFSLESVVFMGVPHAGPRRTLGLRSRVLSLLSTWLTKVASFVMEGVSDGLVEFLHEDTDRLLCTLAAVEAQDDYAVDYRSATSRGSLLFKFAAVASYGLLDEDPVVSRRSSLGLFDDFVNSRAAQKIRKTRELQNRPIQVPLSKAPLNQLWLERPWDPVLRSLLTSGDICRTTTSPYETYELTLRLLQLSHDRLLSSAEKEAAPVSSTQVQRDQSTQRNGEVFHEQEKTRRTEMSRFTMLLVPTTAAACTQTDEAKARLLRDFGTMSTFEHQWWLVCKHHALLSHVVHTALLLPMDDSSPVDDLWWTGTEQ
ncbi:putative transmembrane protein [Toxoplasma gondii RUB]|uniref:Putative transmembrane protein n=1 Tax=Toxoplasma gondii RUB TaxID=935652 RepID=A0A086LXE6_TOXGO|nr:putative transmembrane protein [Toxoplasma gondii RUB]